MEKISFSGEKRKIGKTEAKLYRINDGGNTLKPLEISVDDPKVSVPVPATENETYETAKEVFTN